jgi:hypothetical protein
MQDFSLRLAIEQEHVNKKQLILLAASSRIALAPIFLRKEEVGIFDKQKD